MTNQGLLRTPAPPLPPNIINISTLLCMMVRKGQGRYNYGPKWLKWPVILAAEVDAETTYPGRQDGDPGLELDHSYRMICVKEYKDTPSGKRVSHFQPAENWRQSQVSPLQMI